MLSFEQKMLIVTIVLGVLIVTTMAIGIFLMVTESKPLGDTSPTDLGLVGTKQFNIQVPVTVESGGQFPDLTNATVLYEAKENCHAKSFFITNTAAAITSPVILGAHNMETNEVFVISRHPPLATGQTVFSFFDFFLNKGERLVAWSPPNIFVDVSIVTFKRGPTRISYTGPSPWIHEVPKNKTLVIYPATQFFGTVFHGMVGYNTTTAPHDVTLRYNNRLVGEGTIAPAATDPTDPNIAAIGASFDVAPASSKLETAFPPAVSQSYSCFYFPGVYVKQ